MNIFEEEEATKCSEEMKDEAEYEEEEGHEDVEDAAENPGGEGGESDWIGWSCPQSWDEQVDQHLDEERMWQISWKI